MKWRAIPKCNFEFSNGGSNALKIAFLAMNHINDIRRITRKFLSDQIFFASLGARKKF